MSEIAWKRVTKFKKRNVALRAINRIIVLQKHSLKASRFCQLSYSLLRFLSTLIFIFTHQKAIHLLHFLHHITQTHILLFGFILLQPSIPNPQKPIHQNILATYNLPHTNNNVVEPYHISFLHSIVIVMFRMTIVSF